VRRLRDAVSLVVNDSGDARQLVFNNACRTGANLAGRCEALGICGPILPAWQSGETAMRTRSVPPVCGLSSSRLI
jgi:hypothetical protein